MNGILVTSAFRAALLLFIALAIPAWAQEIRVIDVRALPRAELPAAATTPTHRLTVTLYAFRGTRWQAADIIQATLASAHLLAQCGVALEYAELRTLDAPQRFHYYYTPISRELVRAIEVSRPAVFFVDDTKNRPAFDAEAIGRANSSTRPELADTIWIAYGARDLPHALAHELVHVLSDSGEHSDEPRNLMRIETSAQNQQLSGEQCALLRLRGLANGLLRPFTAQ